MSDAVAGFVSAADIDRRDRYNSMLELLNDVADQTALLPSLVAGHVNETVTQVRTCHLPTPSHAFSRLVTPSHAFSRLLTPSIAVYRRLSPSIAGYRLFPQLAAMLSDLNGGLGGTRRAELEQTFDSRMRKIQVRDLAVDLARSTTDLARNLRPICRDRRRSSAVTNL